MLFLLDSDSAWAFLGSEVWIDTPAGLEGSDSAWLL